MKYAELEYPWKRIFELEWQSVCEGSKAIAAVIVTPQGEIVSEGRNKNSEKAILNPKLAHAETEALRNLDIEKYPDFKEYTLYAGLEPCPMCMGTFAMSDVRKIVIAARDAHGGAMQLIDHSRFLQSRKIEITWLDNELGDMQRAFQVIRELLYNTKEEKRTRMLADFSIHNKRGVDAACSLVADGFLEGRKLAEISAAEVFDELMRRM